MNNLVKVIVAAIVGSAIGVISAQRIAGGADGFFVHRNGPWMSWPEAGAKFANPYARAHFLMSGRLPLSQFDAREYEAASDSKGEQLDADCTYQITGKTPAARWWSLFVIRPDGEPVSGSHSALAARQMVNSKADTISVTLSRQPQPGNWIEPGTTGRLVLVLRLYNPVQSVVGFGSAADLPQIIRKECQ